MFKYEIDRKIDRKLEETEQKNIEPIKFDEPEGKEIPLSPILPWNIFKERHSIFIVFFLLGLLTLIGSIWHIIIFKERWDLEHLMGNTIITILYIPFLILLFFFNKYIGIISIFIFLINLFFIGYHQLGQPFILLLSYKKIENLLPVGSFSLHVIEIWQIIFNLVIVPLTGILMVFHKSSEPPPPRRIVIDGKVYEQ